ATAEHAVKRIIITRRDWIELVIVTPRASDCQAHRRATENIDAIVDDVVHHAEKAPANSEEAHGGKVRFVGWSDQLVGGDLQREKAVVRHVIIEGANDPVA